MSAWKGLSCAATTGLVWKFPNCGWHPVTPLSVFTALVLNVVNDMITFVPYMWRCILPAFPELCGHLATPGCWLSCHLATPGCWLSCHLATPGCWLSCIVHCLHVRLIPASRSTVTTTPVSGASCYIMQGPLLQQRTCGSQNKCHSYMLLLLH